jgi:hypothetical protein
MKTAIITVAHRRAAHLHRQLIGIARSALLPDIHVIVAIDDPDVDNVVAASDTTAHVVHYENGRGPLQVGSARNTGALAALNDGAQLLVFLDVDCIPGRNMLSRYHAAAVSPEHHNALLCGPVTYLPPPRDRKTGYPTVLEPMTDPHPARPAPGDDDVVASTDHELFWSLSFALTSSTWRAVGGFCEQYRGHRLRPDRTARWRSDALGRGRTRLPPVPSGIESSRRTRRRHRAQRNDLPSTMGMVADGRLVERVRAAWTHQARQPIPSHSPVGHSVSQ